LASRWWCKINAANLRCGVLANTAPVTTDQTGYALKIVASSFSSSVEYKNFFPAPDHSKEVKHAFKNAFNYDPDAATLQTYVSKLDAGTITVADMTVDVIGTAKLTPNGKLHLDNKTAFSNYFINIYPQTTVHEIEISTTQFTSITHDPKTLETAKTGVVALAADNTAPVFANASVNGKNLVLAYNDVSPLSTTVAKNAFLVHANKSVADITDAVVDAAANTITLTLANAVSKTDAVDVSYFAAPANPSLSNVAIQDIAGNDAIFLNQHAVVNNTGSTAPVAPTAPVDPTAPLPPVSPTAPTAPTAPVDPTAPPPVSPTAPVPPTAPVNPTAPTSPTAPTAPVNALTGTSGVDTLTGTANADSIIGAGSADKLTGGASADTFIYKAISITDLMNEVGSALGVNATTAPSLTAVETITDFISGTDKIQLSVALANSVNGTNSTVYTATTTTGLLAADFVATTATGLAADAGNARFYVNTANNVLYFDKADDTVINANNAYTAGAADDFAVLQLTGAVIGTDFVFA
jgi:hypothetical protein